MDPGFATVNSQQQTTEIPSEIYEPLMSIALHGYTPSDIHVWYQSMLRLVRWRNIDTTQAPYATLNPAPSSSADAPCPAFLDTECAARRATLATVDSCISPINKFCAIPSTEIPAMGGDASQVGPMYNIATQDSMSQAYNTPQSYQTYATTPQQLDPTPEPPPSQQLVASWSPTPSSAAEPDVYALANSTSLSTGNLMAMAAEPPNNAAAYPWLSAQDIGSSMHTRTHSQQSQLSHQSLPATTQQMGQHPLHHQQQQQPPPSQPPFLSPEYNTQLPGTAMPVLVPYASSSGSSSNYTKAAAIPTGPGASLYSSSTGGYFPIIHVSSTRRRRKALHKGVKKMVQPLKTRRQQSV